MLRILASLSGGLGFLEGSAEGVRLGVICRRILDILALIGCGAPNAQCALLRDLLGVVSLVTDGLLGEGCSVVCEWRGLVGVLDSGHCCGGSGAEADLGVLEWTWHISVGMAAVMDVLECP